MLFSLNGALAVNFPLITNISDVLPIIANKEEFFVADKGNYKVINYTVVRPDTFPEIISNDDAILRECRGLIFSSDGRLIARRFEKFFNLGERPDTQFDKIDFADDFVILDKLDGSMVSPIPFYTGSVLEMIRWGTKMGVTDIALDVEKFVEDRGQYSEFVETLVQNGYTPIFEYISPHNRIVVKYSNENLILTAIRRNDSGQYTNYDEMALLAEQNNIPVVKSWGGNWQGIQQFLADIKDTTDIEGYVLRFSNGLQLKTKVSWYIAIHKVKDNLSLEKNVVDIIVSEKADDLKPLMLVDDKISFEAFENSILNGLLKTSKEIEEIVSGAKNTMDKKTFAITVVSSYPKLKTFMFSVWDGYNALELLRDHVAKNTGSKTKIDEVRHLWGSARWTHGVVTGD